MIAHSDVIPLFEDLLVRGRGLVGMLKVYLDRGQKDDSKDGVMCVASVIFKATPYKQFIRSWNQFLKPWGASAFHATDFYNGAGEFKRNTPEREKLFAEDSRRIPSLLGVRVKHILLVSFRPAEFLEVASPQWKEKFGTSAHSHAVQLCLISNGWWRYAHCRNESFAYFIETGDPDQGEVVKTVERMRNDSETGTAAVIKVSSFTPVDKGLARGLEAADLLAWHWNKYYMDKIRTGQEDDPRKDFAALISSARNRIKYIFASGDKLKYFFSLVPPEVLGEPNDAE